MSVRQSHVTGSRSTCTVTTAPGRATRGEGPRRPMRVSCSAWRAPPDASRARETAPSAQSEAMWSRRSASGKCAWPAR